VPRGMDVSQLEGCCDVPRTDSFGRVTQDVLQSGFSEFPRS
jgi:hypothetical protein